MSDESEFPSPASKAFANHLAKYAYSSNSTSPSKLAGPSRLGKSPSKARIPVVDIPTSPSKRTAATVNGRTTPRKRGKRSIEDEEKFDGGDDGSDHEESARTPDKKQVKKKKQISNEKGKVKGKGPRGYAPPELYEHLRPVNDLLEKDLDIVFCGINPGKRSSTMGHHFSHPTNKFWRSLHQSGLTPRLLDPTEDHLMLEYGYGLTNLVDRPTSEQSELSTLEMRLNVFNLTSKFEKHKPKIVCFVGKKIWDVYESVVKRTATLSTNDEDVKLETGVVEVKQEMDMSDYTQVESSTSKVKGVVKLEKLDDPVSSSLSPPPIDDPPIVKLENAEQLLKIENDEETKSIHPISAKSPKKRLRSTKPKVEPFDATKPRKFRLPHYTAHAQPELANSKKEVVGYTYFWVVPNTSGLERTQLPEQIVNFTALRTFLQELKVREDLAEGEWWDIDVGGVERTVEDLKKVALSRKA